MIIMTLENGRPGTPMPAFGVGAGGQYSDNELNQIATYILAVQTGEVEPVDAQAFVGRSGEDLFADNCARCHGVEGQGVVGPNLVNIFERYGIGPDDDPEQARLVIRQAIEQGRYVPGNAPMPPFAGVLTDDAIDAIIDHIESIQTTGGPRFGQLGPHPLDPEGDQ
jgi:mono/diheme cytochrome c family protein